MRMNLNSEPRRNAKVSLCSAAFQPLNDLCIRNSTMISVFSYRQQEEEIRVTQTQVSDSGWINFHLCTYLLPQFKPLGSTSIFIHCTAAGSHYRNTNCLISAPPADADDLFGPPPNDNDDLFAPGDSPFGKPGGLFSSSKGLFDDDDEEGNQVIYLFSFTWLYPNSLLLMNAYHTDIHLILIFNILCWLRIRCCPILRSCMC